MAHDVVGQEASSLQCLPDPRRIVLGRALHGFRTRPSHFLVTHVTVERQHAMVRSNVSSEKTAAKGPKSVTGQYAAVVGDVGIGPTAAARQGNAIVKRESEEQQDTRAR